MKNDTQHLDYLISQYVDGCLDPASRKSLEQQLVHNPSARQLYKGHRDVQDMLDDWGNRIPMIDWADFDKTLASRLENETVGGTAQDSFFRRLRPVAAAAALFLAVGVGYAWRAFSTTPTLVPMNVAQNTPATHTTRAFVDDQNLAPKASMASVRVNDAPGFADVRTPTGVAVTPPDDSNATPLKDPGRYGAGPGTLLEAVAPPKSGSVSAVIVPAAKPDKDNKDPAFP